MKEVKGIRRIRREEKLVKDGNLKVMKDEGGGVYDRENISMIYIVETKGRLG